MKILQTIRNNYENVELCKPFKESTYVFFTKNVEQNFSICQYVRFQIKLQITLQAHRVTIMQKPNKNAAAIGMGDFGFPTINTTEIVK